MAAPLALYFSISALVFMLVLVLGIEVGIGIGHGIRAERLTYNWRRRVGELELHTERASRRFALFLARELSQ